MADWDLLVGLGAALLHWGELYFVGERGRERVVFGVGVGGPIIASSSSPIIIPESIHQQFSIPQPALMASIIYITIQLLVASSDTDGDVNQQDDESFVSWPG